MKIFRFGIPIMVALLAILPLSVISNDVDRNITELKEELNHSSEKEKAAILVEISNYFRYSNYDSAFNYAQLADSYAQRFDQTSERVFALLLMARNSSNIGKTTYAVNLYKKAKEIALNSGNGELLAHVYLEYSIYHTSKFNYTEVLSDLDSSLYYITKNNIDKLKPRVFYRIASLYNTLNEIPVAIRYVQLARFALDKYDDIEVRVKVDHMEGMILFEQSNRQLSLEFLQTALRLSKKVKRRRMEQVSYRRLAEYYINTKEYNTAKSYIDSSLLICDELGLHIERSALITYLAHVAWSVNDFQTALDYNFKALAIREKTSHSIAVSSSLLNIGGNYIKLKDYKNAEYYTEKGLIIAKEQDALVYIERGYNLLSQVYEKTGKYQLALDFFRTKTMYNDSIFRIKSTEKTLFLSNLYEIEREKRQIDSEKLQKVSTNIIYLIIVMILLTGIILLLFWNSYVRKKHHKEILKLSKVIETTDQGVLISDAKGNIDYFNNGAIKLLNYKDSSDFKGKNIIDIVDFKGTVLLNQVVLPQIQKTGSWSGEIDFTTKEGDKGVAYLTCSALVEGRKPDLFVAIFTDISERKRYEKALKTSQKELQETVETQEKMFSIIAHDLTGPFNTILGFTSELANNFDSYEKDDLVKFSKIINESSKNTYNLLSNLLHWSRTRLGRIEINKTEIDLFPIVEQNINLLSPTAQNKDITIVNNIDQDSQILADGATLDIVIRNLITNAIKFTPRNGEITISAKREEKVSEISVIDTGIGIKPEDLEDIFKESGAKSTPGTENEKGTGLGLIVCNELVLLNNGTIAIDSELNKGTRFTITLPNQ